MRDLKLVVKPIGDNEPMFIMNNVLTPFVKQYFDTIYEGAKRFSLRHINEDGKLPRIDFKDCVFGIDDCGNAYIEVDFGGTYHLRESSFITDSELKHIVKTLQVLLDTAATPINSNLRISIETLQ